MKLDYPIETNKRVDRNGEEVIETDTILYEVDDREIYKIGIFHLPSVEQQEKMLVAWDNEFSDERKAQAVAETMRFFGDEVYDHFRQAALDSAFAPTSGESGKVDKVIEEKPKAPYSANDEVNSASLIKGVEEMNEQERNKKIEKTFSESAEGYNSPITVVFREIAGGFEEAVENEGLRAVRKVAVYVDKEELAKALNYDRNQYNKGYDIGFWRGEKIAAKRFAAAIKERLRIPEKRACNTDTFSKAQIRAVVNEILEEMVGEVEKND